MWLNLFKETTGEAVCAHLLFSACSSLITISTLIVYLKEKNSAHLCLANQCTTTDLAAAQKHIKSLFCLSHCLHRFHFILENKVGLFQNMLLSKFMLDTRMGTHSILPFSYLPKLNRDITLSEFNVTPSHNFFI